MVVRLSVVVVVLLVFAVSSCNVNRTGFSPGLYEGSLRVNTLAYWGSTQYSVPAFTINPAVTIGADGLPINDAAQTMQLGDTVITITNMSNQIQAGLIRTTGQVSAEIPGYPILAGTYASNVTQPSSDRLLIDQTITIHGIYLGSNLTISFRAVGYVYWR